MIRQGRREHSSMLLYMVIPRGVGRASFLAGSSTRNQRIERLWRDVYRCVASTYHSLFHSMEAIGVLDPDNEVDLMVLQCIYLLVSTTH